LFKGFKNWRQSPHPLYVNTWTEIGLPVFVRYLYYGLTGTVNLNFFDLKSKFSGSMIKEDLLSGTTLTPVSFRWTFVGHTFKGFKQPLMQSQKSFGKHVRHNKGFHSLIVS
jgi:hypothetical protein